MGTFALNKKIQNEFNVSSPNKKQLVIGDKNISDREIGSFKKRITTTLKFLMVTLGEVVDINLALPNIDGLSTLARKAVLLPIKKKTLWS